MPFRSQAQWRWAFGTDQPFADEWARETPGGRGKSRPPAVKISKTSTKEPKYGARAGETITGQLGRDTSGRFTNIGGLRGMIARATGGPKKGGAKKPKKTDEERAAEREARAAERAAEVKRVAEETAQAVGYDADSYAALSSIVDDEQEYDKVKDNPAVAKLIEKGMLKVENGMVTTTSEGKSFAKALESGKPGRAAFAEARAAKRIADEAKRAAEQAKPKKGSGGSGKKKPAKPALDKEEPAKESPKVTAQADGYAEAVRKLRDELRTNGDKYTAAERKKIADTANAYEEALFEATGQTVGARLADINKRQVAEVEGLLTAANKRLQAAKTPRQKKIAQRIVKKYQDALKKLKKKPKQTTKEFKPPAGVQAAARRGLELRRKFGRGGTSVGIARARDLSNGASISDATIMRMSSFFARHAVDERPGWSNPENPSNGYIAHMLWGGDAGRSWAEAMSKRVQAKREKHLPGKHDQSAHGRRGRAGTAFRGAYTAARAEGKTHREAWQAAKGAAQTERDAMRAERAAARATKKPQPKPGIALKFDEPTKLAPRPVAMEMLTLEGPVMREALKRYRQASLDLPATQKARARGDQLVEHLTGKKFDGTPNSPEHYAWLDKELRALVDDTTDPVKFVEINTRLRELDNGNTTSSELLTLSGSIKYASDIANPDTNDPARQKFRDSIALQDAVSHPSFQALVYELLGYDAKPRLVNGLEDLRNVDGAQYPDGTTRTFFRGVKSRTGIDPATMQPREGLSARQILDDLREGDKHFVGIGVYGNGTYMASGYDGNDERGAYGEARGYAGNDGEVIAISINRDAKFARINENIRSSKEFRARAYEHAKTMSVEDGNIFINVLESMNEGARLALQGWDGIQATNSYYVLYNRGVSTMARQSITRDMTRDN